MATLRKIDISLVFIFCFRQLLSIDPVPNMFKILQSWVVSMYMHQHGMPFNVSQSSLFITRKHLATLISLAKEAVLS